MAARWRDYRGKHSINTCEEALFLCQFLRSVNWARMFQLLPTGVQGVSSGTKRGSLPLLARRLLKVSVIVLLKIQLLWKDFRSATTFETHFYQKERKHLMSLIDSSLFHCECKSGGRIRKCVHVFLHCCNQCLLPCVAE